MRKNRVTRKAQTQKARRSATTQARVLDLRNGSRTTPVASGKTYKRSSNFTAIKEQM